MSLTKNQLKQVDEETKEFMSMEKAKNLEWKLQVENFLLDYGWAILIVIVSLIALIVALILLK